MKNPVYSREEAIVRAKHFIAEKIDYESLEWKTDRFGRTEEIETEAFRIRRGLDGETGMRIEIRNILKYNPIMRDLKIREEKEKEEKQIQRIGKPYLI